MAVGYLQVFIKIWGHCLVQWRDRGPSNTFLQDFFKDLQDYGFMSVRDILFCLLLGVVFTILRYVLTVAVFKPVSIWFQLTKKDQRKFPESAFKVLFYSSAYGYCSYIMLKAGYLQDPGYCWKGWHKGMPIPVDIYALYVIEAGFYFHSIYATLFMDMWRRDSILMIVHHLLANTLILFSMALRYHKIGIMVIFLHDICDVFLESTKICLALKSRGGMRHRIPGILSNIGFLLFASSWFMCRLYLYPIKVLYCAGYDAFQHIPAAPLYFFFNGMLWALFLMNVWWFQFILWLIFRILTGRSREVEDTREIPKVTEKSPAVNEANHKSLTDGNPFGNRDGVDYGDQVDSVIPNNEKKQEKDEPVAGRDKTAQSRRRQPRTKPANH